MPRPQIGVLAIKMEEVSKQYTIYCLYHHQVSSALIRLNVMDLQFSLFSAFLIHSL